jgi:hypothetical protein
LIGGVETGKSAIGKEEEFIWNLDENDGEFTAPV